jgi:drug/metabolite transporter (DMT)-like permease
MAFIWAAAKYQMVYRSVIDSLPPQLSSRYAFPVYALSPSTPLPLQAEYVNSLWGGSVGFLCVSLCFFSLQEIGAGLAAFAVFCWSVVYALKARKNYRENCSQALARSDREEP